MSEPDARELEQPQPERLDDPQTVSSEGPPAEPIDEVEPVAESVDPSGVEGSFDGESEETIVDPTRVCPTCSEVAPAKAKFCENCATELDTGQVLDEPVAIGRPCVDCGAAGDNIDGEGYCAMCGHKQPSGRDHLEIDLGWVAVVSDKGLRHHKNEDGTSIAALPATALSGDRGAVLVVCDGVSTTDHPEQASEAAAEAARGVLERAAVDRPTDLLRAMQEAVDAAQRAVLTIDPIPGGQGNPSCTFVAAVALDQGDGHLALTVGWLGDSRGYWIDAAGATQLTTDHSWANEQVDAGLISEEEAQSDRRAHTITRWLGRDAIDLEASLLQLDVPAAGMVLLCSDGLWNYTQRAEDLFGQVTGSSHTQPVDLARQLTTFAIESGGHDNITVAVAQFATSSTSGGLPIDPTESEAVTTAASVSRRSSGPGETELGLEQNAGPVKDSRAEQA